MKTVNAIAALTLLSAVAIPLVSAQSDDVLAVQR
jgi:hypothetical protein